MSLDRRGFLGGVAVTVLPLGTPARAAAAADLVPALPVTAGGGGPADDHAKAAMLILEAGTGSIRLKPEPGAATAVWGYRGQVPGPLLRLKKGAELSVRLVNALPQATSLCWHGVRTANAMDGVAGLTQKPVLPGDSFDYRFTPPDSGLFWYHPHVWPQTAEQMDRGLYGVLIVEEAEPPAVDEELLLVLDDWTLDSTGQIAGDFVAPEAARRAGRIGPLVTVNSAPAPLKRVLPPGSRLRLRLLSAVGARIMIIGFEGVHPMVLAIDGQPCELFEPVRQTIPVGPGSRFDIMIDLPAEAGKTASLILRGDGEPDRQLVAFETAGAILKPRGPIAALPANTALPAAIPLERAMKMNLVIDGGAKPPAPPPDPQKESLVPPRGGGKRSRKVPGTGAGRGHDTLAAKTLPNPVAANPVVANPVAATPVVAAPAADPSHIWTINGVASDGFSGKPLFTVKRGAPVSLAFVNKSAFAQQIHVHGHVMRLLHDLDDGWEPYWRDAVLVADGHTKHVAFIADNPGKWTIESLVLDRQVTGLAAWFEVL